MHEVSQSMLDRAKPNDTVFVGGAPWVVLAIGGRQPAAEGNYAAATVIHTVPGNDYHPFSIHTLYFVDDGSVHHWAAYTGTPCRTLTDAVKEFKARTREVA